MLWEAILNMFENDRSAARGNMAVRDLIIFRHENELGKEAAYKLFDRVKVTKKDASKAPRAYSDYVVSVDEMEMPEGVTVIRKH